MEIVFLSGLAIGVLLTLGTFQVHAWRRQQWLQTTEGREFALRHHFQGLMAATTQHGWCPSLKDICQVQPMVEGLPKDQAP